MVVPCGTWYPTSWSCYDSWIETVGTWASKMHILCRPAMWWFSWKIPRPWHTCEGHGQEKCSSSCLALTSGWLEREMDFDVKSSIRSHLTCDGMWCLFLSFSSPLFQISEILSLVAWCGMYFLASCVPINSSWISANGLPGCWTWKMRRCQWLRETGDAKVLTLMEHVFIQVQEIVTYVYSILHTIIQYELDKTCFSMSTLLNSCSGIFCANLHVRLVCNCTWIPWWIYHTPT